MNKLFLFPYKEWIKISFSFLLYKLRLSSFFILRYDQYLISIKEIIKTKFKIDVGFSRIINCYDGSSRFSLRKYSSDIMVFEQVIINQEYKPVVEVFNKLGYKPNFILDLGANIGLTSVFFCNIFPEVTILAVEPDKKNAEVLKKNIENNRLQHAIKLVEGAVWNKDTFLQTKLGFRDSEGWSIQVEEVDSARGALKGYTIESLMKLVQFEEVDLLKIDIEGAEKKLFENKESIAFLEKVKVLCIEIHEEMCPEQQVTQWLSKFEFSFFRSGEHLIAYKKSIGN